jgi:F420-dependent oxidoreductase-like protein
VPHFGLHLNSLAYPGVPVAGLFDRARAIAGVAERSGFDSVWVLDHMVQGGHAGGPSEPMPEAYTLLGALAASTSRVELGTLVTAATFRNPAHLAKSVTTLDMVSVGRAICGMGAGWNEEEHVAYGYAFPKLGERMDRLEEAVQICRAMFTEERPRFEGRHYTIDAALNVPRPIRPGGPPILIGGNGEKRTIPMIARYADMSCFPKHTPPEEVSRKLARLDECLEKEGRDRDAVTKLRKRTMVISSSKREARRKSAKLQKSWDESRELYRGRVVEGDPDEVFEQVSADLALGFDGLIVNVVDDHDLELVALAGEVLDRCRNAR